MTNTNRVTVGEQLEVMRADILKHLSQEIEESEIDTGSFEWYPHLELYYYHFVKALVVSKPPLFTEFLSWARSVQQSRKLPQTTFETINSLFKQELHEVLEPKDSEEALHFFELAIKQSQQLTSTTESYLEYLLALSVTMIHYLDDQLWQNIGADGYARDAEEVIQTATTLIEKGA